MLNLLGFQLLQPIRRCSPGCFPLFFPNPPSSSLPSVTMRLLPLLSFSCLAVFSAQGGEARLSAPRQLQAEVEEPEADPRFEYLGEILLHIIKDFFIDEVMEELADD
ncbi:hypothetical protein Esti_000872 [Eimeria stiedai]